MDILEKLDKEITEQTRNGRTEVYLSINDLRTIGMTIIEEDKRTYVDVASVKTAMKRYAFRQSMKAETTPVVTKTAKSFMDREER